MSEVRSALPYISQFIITKIPTQKWEPTGMADEQGNELYLKGFDIPGIQVEITTYMGDIKGPARPYQFPLKQFYLDLVSELQVPVTERDQLEAVQEKTPEQNIRLKRLNQLISSQKIVEKQAQIQTILDNPDTIWAEDVLLAGNLPTFEDFWDNVVSDGLDLFPSWAEPAEPIGGIPIYLKDMQIKASIPYEGSKIVDMKMGAFLDENSTINPVVYSLVFEDTASRNQRLGRLSALQTALQGRINLLESTPEENTQERTQIEAEIADYSRQIAEIEALEIGLLSELLATPAILETLPTFLMAIIGALRTKHWPDLDMTVVQTRLLQNLQEMIAVLNVPSATTNTGSKSDDKPVS